MDKYILFKLADKRFCLSIEKIVEVRKFESIVINEELQWPIIAIIEAKNTKVPLLDLYDHLAGEKIRKTKNYSPENEIFILQKDDNLYGILIDNSIGVIKNDSSKLLPLPRYLPGVNKKFYHGLMRIDKDLHLVLNEESLFPNSKKK